MIRISISCNGRHIKVKRGLFSTERPLMSMQVVQKQVKEIGYPHQNCLMVNNDCVGSLYSASKCLDEICRHVSRLFTLVIFLLLVSPSLRIIFCNFIDEGIFFSALTFLSNSSIFKSFRFSSSSCSLVEKVLNCFYRCDGDYFQGIKLGFTSRILL